MAKLIIVSICVVLLIALAIAWIAYVVVNIRLEFWSIFKWIGYSFLVKIALGVIAGLLIKWIDEK